MARPRKIKPEEVTEENVTPVVEESSEEVAETVEEIAETVEEVVLPKPEPIIIRVPWVPVGAHQDPPEITNPAPVNPEPEPEPVAEAKMRFQVWKNGELVDDVESDSEKIEEYIQANRNQLDNWIIELSSPPPDDNDLIFFNYGPQKQNYQTWLAFFNQNGYAPTEPTIKSWMEYYKMVHLTMTEEEIVTRLKGMPDYSFVPYHP